MEVGEAVLALNFIDSQLNLAERVVLIFLKVSKGDLKDSTLESLVGVLETGGTVDEGFSDAINSPSVPVHIRSFTPRISSSPHRYPTFYP